MTRQAHELLENSGETKHFFDEYPFRCVLSFEPLIDELEVSISEDTDKGRRQKETLDEILSAAPQLREPITDPAVLPRLRPWIEKPMAMVFPPIYWDTEPIAAVVPFIIKPVFVSEMFQRLFMDSNGRLTARRNVPEASFNRGRLIRGYILVLEKLYGVSHRFDFPIVHIVLESPKFSASL